MSKLFQHTGKKMYRWEVVLYCKCNRNLVQQRCSSASATNSTTTTTGHKILSRRLVEQQQAHKMKLKVGCDTKAKAPKKEDETPWPRSWRIFGYSVAVLSIPLTLAGLIMEQPAIRSCIENEDDDTTLGSQLVHFIRSRYGEVMVHTAPPDHPTKQTQEEEEERGFENEDPPPVRSNQKYIRALLNQKHTIEVHDPASGDLCTSLDGQLNLDQTIDELVKGTTTTNVANDRATTANISIRFIDHDEPQNDAVFPETNFTIADTTSPVDNIRIMTNAFSTWHYIPSSSSSTSPTQQNTILSDDQILQSKLEYREQELQDMLRDPTSTKSVDDIMHELNQVRRELKSVRGGWRKFVPFL